MIFSKGGRDMLVEKVTTAPQKYQLLTVRAVATGGASHTPPVVAGADLASLWY